MVPSAGAERSAEIVALRASGMRLAEIGWRYGLSRQRVAQIVDQAGGVPVEEVREVRRESELERALGRSRELLERYRDGLPILRIARDTELPVRAVRATIAELATDADRARRKRAAAAAAPTPSPEFTDEQLTAGLLRVAGRLGHAPTGGEYKRLASELGLAAMPTVYQRFGGWRAALQRAGLDAPPARSYRGTEWHLAACWNALVSVADQLGDPPRYRRYAELAREREDLPSPATVRARLGLWSGIAAALQTRNGAAASDPPDARQSHNGAGPPMVAAKANPSVAAGPAQPPSTGGLLSRQSVRCLRYIAEHPGSSSTQVQTGVGIRHPSQISNVLVRLERDRLAYTERGRRALNAWEVTREGAAVLAGLPEGIYD